MTPEQRRKVEEIVARACLATPTTGRAFFRGLGGAHAQNDHAWGVQSAGQPVDFVVAYTLGGGDRVRAMRDAEFLARARADVLLLVELIEEARDAARRECWEIAAAEFRRAHAEGRLDFLAYGRVADLILASGPMNMASSPAQPESPAAGAAAGGGAS